MKNARVKLKLPFSKQTFLIEGSAHDKSIIGAIETNAGFYEPHIMAFLNKIIKKNYVCLDIGANIGVISLCISQLAKEGTVFSFEPSMNNFAYLKKNIKLNNQKNIIPINIGLFDKKCDLSFSYVEQVAGCSFISEESGIHEGVNEAIHCEKLDTFIAERKIKHVDFIKLDVEGAEIKTLLGAINTIKGMQPEMIIEFNPVPLKRFFNKNPITLYSLLAKIYPYIYLIPFNGDRLIKIDNYKKLMNLLGKGKGWEDLYCSYKKLSI